MFENQFYNPQMPNYQSQYQQRLASLQNSTQQPMELIRVTGEAGARAYPMPPNSIVPLFDGSDDILYIKSTDGAGFPTVRKFAFTEVQNTPAPDTAQFVTRAEFDELKGMIENGKQPVPEKSDSTSK